MNVVSGTPAYDNSLVEGLNPGGTNLDGTTATADFVAPEAASNAPTTAGNYRLQSKAPRMPLMRATTASTAN